MHSLSWGSRPCPSEPGSRTRRRPVPQPEGRAIEQPGRRDAEANPAAPANDCGSGSVQLAGYDEVASAPAPGRMPGEPGPSPASALGEFAQAGPQPPTPRPPAPGAPAQPPPAGPSQPRAGTGGVPAPTPGPAAPPGPAVTPPGEAGPGGALALGPQPPGPPPGTAGQPDRRTAALAGAAGAAGGRSRPQHASEIRVPSTSARSRARAPRSRS